MKKSYLMIAAAALVFASCGKENVLNEVSEEQTAISFGSYTDNLTKGSTKPTRTNYVLEDYHQTMKVYGTKKDADNDVQKVFNGVTCTYDSDASTDLTGEWTYAPARFWDKQSNYCFAAFAPASAAMTYIFFNDATSEVEAAGGKFTSTSNYTIAGQNRMEDNGVQAAEINTGFDGTTGSPKDVDIMVADYTTKAGSTGGTVDLCFKHTFAKLVVALKAKSAAPADASEAGYTINVTNVTVKDFHSTGAYGETAGKWATSGTDKVNYVYTAAGDASAVSGKIKLTTSEQYFVESLVMPQNVADTQLITLEYSITSQDGAGNSYTEDFKYTANMDDIFAATRYDENNKYTITFTINPEDNVIKFDAGVYEWATGETATPSIN